MILLSKSDRHGDISFTCTCFLDNPINHPLKGFKSSRSRQSLLNASQYSMFVKLSWSTRTLLISQSLHLKVMTMGLSLWGWMSVAYFSEKVIVASGVWSLHYVLTSGRFYTLKIWIAFLLRAELVSSPPDESFCYGVKHEAHNFTTFALRFLISFVGARSSSFFSLLWVRLVFLMGGVAIHIFLEMPLMY